MGNSFGISLELPVRFSTVPFGSVRYLRVLFHKHGSEVPSVQGMPERLAMGSDWVTHARPWVARGWPMGGHGRPMVDLEFIRNSLGINGEVLWKKSGIGRQIL